MQAFTQKIGLLYQFFTLLHEQEWMIYQAIYWGLVVLEQNDIAIDAFFNEGMQKNLLTEIRNNIVLFTGNERGFSSITKQRFKFLSEFINTELQNQRLEEIDFSVYLKRHLTKQENEQQSDIVDSIKQLDSMRLNRPDAVTKTIEDLIEDMSRNSFSNSPCLSTTRSD